MPFGFGPFFYTFNPQRKQAFDADASAQSHDSLLSSRTLESAMARIIDFVRPGASSHFCPPLRLPLVKNL